MKWIQARRSSTHCAGLVWEGTRQGEEWGTVPFSDLSSLQVNGNSALLGVGSLEMAVLASLSAHPSPLVCPGHWDLCRTECPLGSAKKQNPALWTPPGFAHRLLQEITKKDSSQALGSRAITVSFEQYYVFQPGR